MNEYIYDDGGAITIMPITTPFDRSKYDIYPPGTIEGIDEEIVLVNKIKEIPLTDKLLAVPITILDWNRDYYYGEMYEMPYSVDISWAATHLPAPPGKSKKPYVRFLIRLCTNWLYKFN